MENMWSIVLACLVIAFIIFFLQKNDNLPPSPFSLPIIGHLYLVSLRELPQNFFSRLAKTYGPLMLLRMGCMKAIVVSDVNTAKEVLKTQDAHFASRPQLTIGRYIAYNGLNVGLAPYNKELMESRKFLLMELLTPKKLASFESVKTEELSWFIRILGKASLKERAVTLRVYITSLSYNIITRMLMGKRYYGLFPEDKIGTADGVEFNEVKTKAFLFGMDGSLADYFPYLSWLDWKIPSMKKAHRDIDKFLQAIVDEHRLKPENDFLNVVLTSSPLDKEERIKGLLFDIMTGGTDTTASTIEWGLAQLLRNPLVYQKAQAEIDRVVGSTRKVEASDIPNMPYLHAVVKETFRLHPTAPFLVPHFSIQECQVNGYTVPSGTTVFVNIHAIGRDPNVWENPLEFQPERFLERHKHVDPLGNSFELLPFGAGRRGCPGKTLALATVHLTIASLLHSFNWKTEDKIDLEEARGATNCMLHPLKAFPLPRMDLKGLYPTDKCIDPLD